MQIRRPSGILNLSSQQDLLGDPLPTRLDADMLVLVYTVSPREYSDICGGGTIAAAFPHALEARTGRPLAGVLLLCESFGRVARDLAVIAHEVMHALVFHPALLDDLVSYAEGAPLEGREPLATDSAGRTYIATPQVRVEAARLFNCSSLAGALVEDGAGGASDEGTAGAGHFEHSVFYVRLLAAFSAWVRV